MHCLERDIHKATIHQWSLQPWTGWRLRMWQNDRVKADSSGKWNRLHYQSFVRCIRSRRYEFWGKYSCEGDHHLSAFFHLINVRYFCMYLKTRLFNKFHSHHTNPAPSTSQSPRWRRDLAMRSWQEHVKWKASPRLSTSGVPVSEWMNGFPFVSALRFYLEYKNREWDFFSQRWWSDEVMIENLSTTATSGSLTIVSSAV